MFTESATKLCFFIFILFIYFFIFYFQTKDEHKDQHKTIFLNIGIHMHLRN